MTAASDPWQLGGSPHDRARALSAESAARAKSESRQRGRCCGCGRPGTVAEVGSHMTNCAEVIALYRADPGSVLGPREAYLAHQEEAAVPEPQEQAPAVPDPEPSPAAELEHVPEPELVSDMETFQDHVRAWERLESDTNWARGDIAASLETKTGGIGRMSEFAQAVGVKYGTLQSYRTVARAYPQKSRRLDISWSVHQAFAAQPDRLKLLGSRKQWTLGAARAEVEKRKPAPALPPGTAPGASQTDAPEVPSAPDGPVPVAVAPDPGPDGNQEVPGAAPVARKDQESYRAAWRQYRHLQGAAGGLWRTRGNAGRKNPPPVPPVENIDAQIAVLRILRAGGADPGPDTDPAVLQAEVARLEADNAALRKRNAEMRAELEREGD